MYFIILTKKKKGKYLKRNLNNQRTYTNSTFFSNKKFQKIEVNFFNLKEDL